MSFAAREQHHSPFEQDIETYLREQGFLLASATYHDVMPPEIAAILRRRTSPTATYLRHRADRIAVHPTLEVEFEWEAKTHTNPRLHDCCIDADQLVEYATKVDRGILCLFCYRDATVGPPMEVGFWMHHMPPLREVRLPDRWTGEAREQKAEAIRLWLGYEPRPSRTPATGSGDPFGIIDCRELAQLPDWREHVIDLIEQAAVCLP